MLFSLIIPVYNRPDEVDELLAKYPNFQIFPLRGNVGTRLQKLDNGEFDAILLAAAGLIRG